jgi:RNA polymerase sigma-70 factor (ECF subfamily)
MDFDEDRRLAERMTMGDQRAFDEFFDRFFDRLYRFALVRLDHDAHAAEDVVQQALSRAMQKIKLYRGESALFTWLCRLCRNAIADSFRGKDRAPAHTVPFEDTEEIRTALESLASISTLDPQESVLCQQVHRLVHAVLDYLPTRYGDVLELKYIQGLTTKEIAAQMNVGPKAAESLLARARVAFREAFTTLGTTDVFDGLAGEQR